MVAGCSYGWEVAADHGGTDIGLHRLDADVYTQFPGSEIHWHAAPDTDPRAHLRPRVGRCEAVGSRPLPIAEPADQQTSRCHWLQAEVRSGMRRFAGFPGQRIFHRRRLYLSLRKLLRYGRDLG